MRAHATARIISSARAVGVNISSDASAPETTRFNMFYGCITAPIETRARSRTRTSNRAAAYSASGPYTRGWRRQGGGGGREARSARKHRRPSHVCVRARVQHRRSCRRAGFFGNETERERERGGGEERLVSFQNYLNSEFSGSYLNCLLVFISMLPTRGGATGKAREISIVRWDCPHRLWNFNDTVKTTHETDENVNDERP